MFLWERPNQKISHVGDTNSTQKKDILSPFKETIIKYFKYKKTTCTISEITILIVIKFSFKKVITKWKKASKDTLKLQCDREDYETKIFFIGK